MITFRSILQESVEYSNNGRKVTPTEVTEATIRGLNYLKKLNNKTTSLTNVVQHFDDVAKKLYEMTVMKEWGGATYDPKTGRFATTGFASSSGGQTIEIPIEKAKDFETFKQTLKNFISQNKNSLSKKDYYLGAFRDEKKQTVDFDVTIILPTVQVAEDIQTALKLKGGAYDFATGNGVFGLHT